MTRVEKAYMNLVADLPCAACGNWPVQLHHIRKDQGAGQRAGNFSVIPLCPECHTGGFSIHASRRSFQNTYSSEDKLLDETIGKVMAGLVDRCGL